MIFSLNILFVVEIIINDITNLQIKSRFGIYFVLGDHFLVLKLQKFSLALLNLV